MGQMMEPQKQGNNNNDNVSQEQLAAAVQQEKMVSDLKSNLISIMSHEFRTPLAVIMSTVSLMRLKGDALTRQELTNRLRVIEEQTKCLNEILSEMTFLNQDEIIGHILKPSLVDVTQFFTEVVHNINEVFAQHEPVELIGNMSCEEVSLDSYLMRQIFINLLCNAMKYSSPDKPVTCAYACHDDRLTVIIKDQGIGIPPEDQPYLFKAFYRAHNVGKVAGTGLGMWLVKRAVDTMGGTISFESTLGEGTTFHVTLPINMN